MTHQLLKVGLGVNKAIKNIFSGNQSIILDLNSYSSSKKSNGNKHRSSLSSEITSEGTTLDYKKLLNHKIRFNKPKKNRNYLNTKDIEGAFPMKFRHRNKRLIKQANCKSHFLASGSWSNELKEKPFKPGIKMVNPYQNLGFTIGNRLKLPDSVTALNERLNNSENKINSYRSIGDLDERGHTRNRSANQHALGSVRSELNKSADFDSNRGRSSIILPRIRSGSKNLINTGSKIIKMKPIDSIISVYS